MQRKLMLLGVRIRESTCACANKDVQRTGLPQKPNCGKEDAERKEAGQKEGR